MDANVLQDDKVRLASLGDKESTYGDSHSGILIQDWEQRWASGVSI